MKKVSQKKSSNNIYLDKSSGGNNNKLSPGLYVVAVPIGHPQDVTLRAQSILSSCDVLAAEDTREAKILLKKLSITPPRLIAYHDHNEQESSPGIIDLIQQGQSVGLITDAGTPAISDPGTRVVRDAHKAKVKVIPIPGASSLTAALSVSGLSGGDLFFGGFLPSQGSARINYLKKKQAAAQVLIFFEAPHRLLSTLDDLETVFGPANEICVCRELTKGFEDIALSTVTEAKRHFQVNEPRGEIVLIVKGKPEPKLDMQATKNRINHLLAAGASSSDILEELQALSELPRKELYNLIQYLKKV